jgi:hypothetical protein
MTSNKSQEINNESEIRTLIERWAPQRQAPTDDATMIDLNVTVYVPWGCHGCMVQRFGGSFVES